MRLWFGTFLVYSAGFLGCIAMALKSVWTAAASMILQGAGLFILRQRRAIIYLTYHAHSAIFRAWRT